jgi:hypothetical protein
MAIAPDTKNWTWVVERACPECGFDASAVAFEEIPGLLRENASRWGAVLGRADVRIRPNDATWSPLEYAAHVRDVFRVFTGRFELMLAEDDPAFANWDQDATAIAERYDQQDPAVVNAELLAAAEDSATTLEAIPDAALTRTGRRSDGSVFTVESLARYFVHDPTHHLWDVTHA